MDDEKLLLLTNIRFHHDKPQTSSDGDGHSRTAQYNTSRDRRHHDYSFPESKSSVVLPLIKARKRADTLDHKSKGPSNWRPVRKYAWPTQPGSVDGSGGVFSNSQDDSGVIHETPHKLKKKPHFVNPLLPLPNGAMSISGSSAETLKLLFEKNIYDNQHNLMLRHLNMVERAEHLIHRMPLSYLISKPELFAYAVEKACSILIKPAFTKIHNNKLLAFEKWKIFDPDVQVKGTLNEKQFFYMVISRVFATALKRHVNDRFQTWARLHCTRYNPERLKRYHAAARRLQGWMRRVKQKVRQPYKNLLEAVLKCIHRRKAIKFTVEFERARRRAYRKMRKGIANRRRVYFAARIIQRIFRWIRLYRYLKWRNTRLRAARRLQRWRRKWVKKRSKKDKLLIHLGLASGGYTKVWSKLPESFKCFGILLGMEQCISKLQRWYFTVCGRLDLYMKLAARRAKMELELKINTNAAIIQNGYRAHLWRLLIYAAVVNNRARRISRGFRAYQYRKWNWYQMARREKRPREKVSYYLGRLVGWMLLYERFERRKLVLDERKRLEQDSSSRIQHCYRSYTIWKAYIKEKLRKFFAGQRMKRDAVMKAVRTIQRLYRLIYKPSLAPYHLKMCGIRSVRDDMYLFWRSAFAIQKIARIYIQEQRDLLFKRQTAAANRIWYLTKSYLLRLVIHYRIIATRIKRNNAATKIKRNYKRFMELRVFYLRCAIMKQRMIYKALLHDSAAIIQQMIRRKIREYYMPLRIAARKQLAKRRKKEAEDAEHLRQCIAAAKLVKIYRQHQKWCEFLKLAERIRKDLYKHRAAKVIQRFAKKILFMSRFKRAVLRKNQQREADRIRLWQQRAVNHIGKTWKRSRERVSLQARFLLRRQMLDEYKRLERERLKAEADKQQAVADMNDTEDNLKATIAAAWKQGSDATGKNYYYNYVTGESSWDPPENWVMKESDNWVRNVDDRGNVYYYNQKTAESRWLPPCLVCGKESERWCGNCNAAYCLIDHLALHEQNGGPDGTISDRFIPEYVDHKWSACELEREVLKKGQVYCVECKKRACTRVCIECWDYYCQHCFTYVHHVGNLKNHKHIPYSRARRGWMCVKAKDVGERDYYVNGLTGETTFEKPEDLMTEPELAAKRNFLAHKEAAESYIKKIDELQHDIEGLKYERALAIMNGRPTAAAKAPKEKSKKDVDAVDLKKLTGGGILSFFGGGVEKAQYRSRLMAPDERKRGQNRSNYIKSILDQVKVAATDDD